MRTMNKGSVVLGNALNCITYRCGDGCYRPSTKLREGNTFNRVCPWFCPGGPMWPLTMVHWASLYTAPPFSSDMIPHWTPASDIWWPSLEICSNLFTSGRTPTGADIWSLLKHIRSAQAGSTHPPGMLSCSFNVSCKIPNKSEPGE